MAKNALLAAVLLVSACSFLLSQNVKPAGNKASDHGGGDLVARGKYIVEGIAVCSQCHTPRARVMVLSTRADG
jgi:hypothetical protein